MPYIDDTWARSAFQALRQTLDVDDHTRKEMIQFLMDEGFWPADREWASAVARWNSCLNPTKPEFFKMGELWALMRRFGRHQLFQAMADDLGFEVRERPTEERRQRLLERIEHIESELLFELQNTRAELARMDTPDAAPRAASRGVSSPRFSLDDAIPRTAVERVGCP
jgi:hypothetical protein